jgi:hypothetical protein
VSAAPEHYPQGKHCACGKLHTKVEWAEIYNAPLVIGDYHAPRDPERDGWSNVVVGNGWHGSLRVEMRGKWRVSVAWMDDTNDVQVNGEGRHIDPEIALANALERLEVPDSFLAALKRPV